MTADGRECLAAQRLPQTAREQVTVALAMIDAFDVQLAPLTKELRDYARRQTGCKALIAAHYGIGGLCAVTILAELGDARRFDDSRDAVRYGGLDSHRCAAAGSRQPPADTLKWTAQKERAAATLTPAGFTPSTIMSPTRSHPGSRTEVRPGARAHKTRCPSDAHTHHRQRRRAMG